jgi:hypothetical protein
VGGRHEASDGHEVLALEGSRGLKGPAVLTDDMVATRKNDGRDATAAFFESLECRVPQGMHPRVHLGERATAWRAQPTWTNTQKKRSSNWNKSPSSLDFRK